MDEIRISFLSVLLAWLSRIKALFAARVREDPSMSQQSLRPEIRELPLDERVRLVDHIWQSVIDDEAEFNLSAAQREEIEQRLKARRDSPSEYNSWDVVKRRLLGE